MTAATPCKLPTHALLQTLARDGAYVDCYATDVASRVTFEAFVAAFYTTWVFRVERTILALLAARPSTDAQAQELAAGRRDAFAAWTVEARATDQVLLCDFTGRTRSWLMIETLGAGGSITTRLYFGSAVVSRRRAGDDQPTLGSGFRLLLGFHRVYSRILLNAARRRLLRGRRFSSG